MQDLTYKFDAVRGKQNERPFYMASVPFKLLATMLKLDDDDDVNKRSQRILSKPRSRNIAKYIGENHNNGFWVIPPLIGVFDGDFEFEEVNLDGFNSGKIVTSIDSRIVLFDGQHRATGIKEAIQKYPELALQNASIMFFGSMTLSERKQAFHDINYTQKTPSQALCIAYNERSPFDKMVIDVFSDSSIRHLIEYEKNSVSGKSDKVYSLKTLRDFAKIVVGSENVDEETKENLYKLTGKLFDFFNVVSWINYEEMMSTSSLSKIESLDYVPTQSFREKSIAGHAVTLKAVAMLCKSAIELDSIESIERLSNKDTFNRYNNCWEGRCIRDNKMVSNQQAVRLTYYELKRICYIELTDFEIEDEIKLISNVNG